jgi:hypothetical protein
MATTRPTAGADHRRTGSTATTSKTEKCGASFDRRNDRLGFFLTGSALKGSGPAQAGPGRSGRSSILGQPWARPVPWPSAGAHEMGPTQPV